MVGVFEDSTLLKTLAAGGLGVFPAVTRVHDDLVRHNRVQRIDPAKASRNTSTRSAPSRRAHLRSGRRR